MDVSLTDSEKGKYVTHTLYLQDREGRKPVKEEKGITYISMHFNVGPTSDLYCTVHTHFFTPCALHGLPL